MNSKPIHFIIAATLVLALAGCGSLGGILGNPSGTYPSSPSSQSSTLQGTVDRVDTRNQRIDLATSDYNGSRQITSISYDSNTRVNYNGQTGVPSQLQPGDQVQVRAYSNGNGQYVADQIDVTQSMSSNYPNTSPSNTAGDIRGTVASVDTSNRRIDLNATYVNNLRNSTSNNTYSIYYDSNTRVLYQGRTYNPSDLERGDEVDVRLFNNGSGRSLADTITVVRNIRQ